MAFVGRAADPCAQSVEAALIAEGFVAPPRVEATEADFHAPVQDLRRKTELAAESVNVHRPSWTHALRIATALHMVTLVPGKPDPVNQSTKCACLAL